MDDSDRVNFDWWANGNYHRACNATRGFHARMVAYSDKHAKTLDLIVMPVDERWTKTAEEWERSKVVLP